MKIGYFADGKWGHNAFEKLISDKSISIPFICVRNKTMDQTFKRYCNDYKIDYLKHKNVNSRDFLNIIKEYHCDLFVSMSFNQIFKSEIISLPKHNIINCHAGKLPFYRGRNVLNWVLINDEKEFGITVHYVDKEIDNGDIIIQRTFPITDKDNYSSLLEKSYKYCPELLYKAVKKIQNKKVEPINQKSIHKFGFYCTRRRPGDEIINWNQTSREIFNFIRALCDPGPRATTFLNGVELKIDKAEFISNAPSYVDIPGTILKVNDNEAIVKTLDSYIKLVDWKSDIPIKIGSRFK